MNKKTLIKVLLSLVLAIVGTLQFGAVNSNAATAPKSGWVSINSGTLTVKSGPGASYKTVGSLNNNSAVSVYSTTKNGWSEIRYKNQKAYVATNNLRMYSYLMDKKKIYVYKGSYDGQSYRETVGFRKKRDSWDEWYANSITFLLKEDSKGLYNGEPYADYYTALAYPLKVGKEWTEDGMKSKITSINTTLKTPAGTFKNVVVVKNNYNVVEYFAPNIGVIKTTYSGKTVKELTSLKNR